MTELAFVLGTKAGRARVTLQLRLQQIKTPKKKSRVHRDPELKIYKKKSKTSDSNLIFYQNPIQSILDQIKKYSKAPIHMQKNNRTPLAPMRRQDP
jgi:hypothetical protein